MRVTALDYELPEAAIAQRPPPQRDGARMLTVEPAGCTDGNVRDFAEKVPSGALVVLNDTRVRKARLLAAKSTGGRVEVLFLRPEASGGGEVWTALVSSNRRLKAGTKLSVGPAVIILQERGADGQARVRLEVPGDVESFFAEHGHVPLPPYIRREEDIADDDRYQTVFAAWSGSAAAPTAGLHLTAEMLERLRQRDIDIGFATLHVGSGTFLPVRTDDLDDHPMHSEQIHITATLCEQVKSARARGAPVVAVGTTVVRALESASRPDEPACVRECKEETRLLIQPNERLRVVDSLLTNFHAPRSTLLALVGACIGEPRWREVYQWALSKGYRFLSYGDAMWIPEVHKGEVRL